MSDWQVGDWAVCVYATARHGCPVPTPLKVGAVYTVAGIDMTPSDDNEFGLYLAEVSVPFVETEDRVWADSFAESRFRKIDKHEPCEEEFVTLLKRVKRTVNA